MMIDHQVTICRVEWVRQNDEAPTRIARLGGDNAFDLILRVNLRLSLPPKTMMFGRLVEPSQKIRSQPLGKIEHGDHGKQKTRKSPGKQKKQPRGGHGSLPHLLSENPLHYTIAGRQAN
jgi:hypothetical protein